MSHRQSHMQAKQMAAAKRETAIWFREHRDDGALRRSAREPITAADVRAASISRKVRVGTINAARIELARRARLSSDPEALEVRIALVGDVKVRPLNEPIVPDAQKPRFHGRGKKRVRISRTFKY